MGISRRNALKGLVTAGAALAAPSPAAAAVPVASPPDALGLLYDTTLCIGCKACVVACAEANGLEPDRSGFADPIYQSPVSLNGRTKTVIKLYVDGPYRSYMKAQCMHCNDPACATACMIGALAKREYGIVTYDAGKCIGCRYCEVACPFGVPKFEWDSLAPLIVKCELCHHRYADGKGAACAEVCPRGAVVFGKRADLLAEAKSRLAANPDKYVPKVYGETDGGGTQCLYLSHVPFENLGLPALGQEGVSVTQRTLQHGIYQGFAAPIALYGALAVVMLRNRKKSAAAETSGEGGTR